MSLLLELYELISAKEAVINGGAEIKGLIALFHQVFYQPDPRGGLKELVDPRIGDNLGLEIITQLIQFSSKKVSLFVKDITSGKFNLDLRLNGSLVSIGVYGSQPCKDSEDLAVNHDVMQIVECVSFIRNRVLIFVLYKMETTRVERMLQQGGWKVVSIHGDKAQHDRTKALSLFKNGSCPLMIATDVTARGLDIPDVEAVINYSFPLTTEDYVHRIGRTRRANKKGVAYTFFTQQNKVVSMPDVFEGLTGELVNVSREAGQIVPDALLKFGTHVKKKFHYHRHRHCRHPQSLLDEDYDDDEDEDDTEDYS
ncbi:DEAD-box ATP-dependent RNA helicase [Arachis hypogaea]|nr:DEAD-box ATP-dependent RNA helicase [Arachis hypogaea]